MSEIGVEDLGRLEERISELSERQATNARMVLEEIERARRDARERGWNFVVRDTAEILEKLRGTNTPFFGALWFNPVSTSPGTFNFSVQFFNPDPIVYAWFYVHVFVGPALLPDDVGQALALRDTRFPALTVPDFPSSQMQKGAGPVMKLSLPVPKNLEPSNYLVNCFLFTQTYFGVAYYMDRCGFPLKVT
ncbi:MAG TPA: hypothetical protein VK360_01195 [Acidimicrobiales bacterium]|nr:hypothetical protein [Acidimicrobiales bacterium]